LDLIGDVKAGSNKVLLLAHENNGRYCLGRREAGLLETDDRQSPGQVSYLPKGRSNSMRTTCQFLQKVNCSKQVRNAQAILACGTVQQYDPFFSPILHLDQLAGSSYK
jgi:hypothetical protein